MKNIFIVLFFSVVSLFSSETYKDPFITLDKIEGLDIFKTSDTVVEKDGVYYLKLTYSFKINKQSSAMMIYFILNNDVDIDALLKLTNDNECGYDSSPFGMGNIISFSERRGYTNVKNKVNRYATIWGSFVTSDLLIYRSLVEGSFYKEYLVEIANVWPSKIDIPQKFDNNMLEELIKSNDPISKKYLLIDKIVSENLTINEIE